MYFPEPKVVPSGHAVVQPGGQAMQSLLQLVTQSVQFEIHSPLQLVTHSEQFVTQKRVVC